MNEWKLRFIDFDSEFDTIFTNLLALSIILCNHQVMILFTSKYKSLLAWTLRNVNSPMTNNTPCLSKEIYQRYLMKSAFQVTNNYCLTSQTPRKSQKHPQVHFNTLRTAENSAPHTLIRPHTKRQCWYIFHLFAHYPRIETLYPRVYLQTKSFQNHIRHMVSNRRTQRMSYMQL